MRAAIHQLKYRGARHLAEPLGELLLETFDDIGDDTRIGPSADVLVPVPLHSSRLAERGYNQSALLAAELSRATGLPVADGPLRRIRPTEPQMALPAERRRANVVGAFAVRSAELVGARVLLIDDVCTTGSTLEACAAALKAAGTLQVRALTLARVR
jgi:ComF family protein